MAYFRIGTLIRIPAAEVERVECPNTLSSDSEADMQSSGQMAKANVGATVLPPPIGSERRPRPARDGGAVILPLGR